MKIITCCFWRRPTYTKRVLEALRACVGIRDYTLLIHIDGAGQHVFGPPEVLAACRAIDFAEHRIVLKSRNLGCNGNTREALTHGFAHSDYVIHVEDDVLLAPDSLQYFEWAKQFAYRRDIFSIGAWCHPKGWRSECPEQKLPDADETCGLASGFYVWGWATWEDRWWEMDQNWTKEDDMSLSWDTQITSRVRNGRYSLLPHTSRALNIGAEAGTHRGDSLLSYWAGSPGFATGKPPAFKFQE